MKTKTSMRAWPSTVIFEGRTLPVELIPVYAEAYRSRPERSEDYAMFMDEVLAFRELALREATQGSGGSKPEKSE